MTQAQFDTFWELIAEVEHLAKNTHGRASVLMSDTGNAMRKVAFELEDEGLISA